MLRPRFIVSLIAACAFFLLPPIPRANAVVITTAGCADVGISCTLTELMNGAFFSVNGNGFANFIADAFTRPLPTSTTDLIVVTPTCDGCAAFGGGTLVPGFNLSFNGTFGVGSIGNKEIRLIYDFLPSQAIFIAMNTSISTGGFNTNGENFLFNLSSDVDSAALDLNCGTTPNPCVPNHTTGIRIDFLGPESGILHVTDSIVAAIFSNNNPGNPLIQVNSFGQSFVALSEPGSLAIFVALLTALGVTSNRRGNDAARSVSHHAL